MVSGDCKLYYKLFKIYLFILDKKDFVFYFNRGQAFVPVCSNVTTIRFRNRTNSAIVDETCPKHIPIEYQIENTNIFKPGYLRPNEIITQYSTIVNDKNCQNSLIITDENHNSSILIRKIKQNTFVKELNHHLTEIQLTLGNLKNMYDHHAYLVNGTDLIEHLTDFLQETIFENVADNSLLSDRQKSSSKFNDEGNPIETDPLKTIRKSLLNGFFDFFGKIFDSFSKIINYIVFILILLFFFYYFFVSSSKCFLFKKPEIPIERV